MFNITLGQLPAFAILQPLLADLVATDVEVPHVLPHAFKASGLRLVDPDGVLRPGDFFNLRILAADELGVGLGELGRF